MQSDDRGMLSDDREVLPDDKEVQSDRDALSNDRGVLSEKMIINIELCIADEECGDVGYRYTLQCEIFETKESRKLRFSLVRTVL